MTPRTLDVPELSTLRPDETLKQWRKRTRPAKRSRRLFWCSLFDHLPNR